MELIASHAAAAPKATGARSPAVRRAPDLQRAALPGPGWLRLAPVAPGLWPLADGLSLLPALEPTGLLADHSWDVSERGARPGWQTQPTHRSHPRFANRPFVRPSGRARLRCGQENQRHQASYLGGHVGAALGRLCHQGRRARTRGSPPPAGPCVGLLPVVALSLGRPRLRRRGVRRMGGGAAQDGHFAAGGRAAPPRPAWLPGVAQTLDRRTDLWLVYETSPPGAPL